MLNYYRSFVSIVFMMVLAIGCAPLAGGANANAGGTSLAGRTIQQLTLQLTSGNMICADTETDLVIMAYEQDGTRLVTQGVGKGKVPWSDYRLQAQNATISQSGIVKTLGDPMVLMGQQVGIRVMSAHDKGTRAQLSVPISFACPVTLKFSGADGAPGAQGANGQDGRPGANKPTDGAGAAPGEDGAQGVAGFSGTPGLAGMSGDQIQVDVAGLVGGHQGKLMLQVLVNNFTKGVRSMHLVDPVGGSLTILARGGNGGNGGMGGNGGKGGPAGTGSSDGKGGNGGKGGDGGAGGNGGPGGAIAVYANQSAMPYMHLIVFDTAGGAPGNAGRGGSGGIGAPAKSFGDPGSRGAEGIPGPPVAVAGQPSPAPMVQNREVQRLW